MDMRKRVILALLATTGLTGPALAQSGSSAPVNGDSQADNIETVYVTARKRVENEQAVPISMEAYGQADLDKLSIDTIEDLKYVSPSVYIAPTTFRQDTLNVTIRGQRNFDAPSGGGNPGLGFDTASAVYKDGVYYARAIGLGGSLFDIDSVQVLKGPQGTLVGRNSTGGAILYTTREPQSEFGGYIKSTLGDYGRAAMQGAINIPLSDQLFFRMALNVDDQRGYVANYFSNPLSGISNHQPSFGSDKMGGLFSLKWQPDDTFNLVLRADIAAEHDTGSTYHDLGYFIGTVPNFSRPSVCNIPISCLAFTDLLGQDIQPYYANYKTGTALNTDPRAYNALLNSVAREQKYGFWSTEQAVSNVSVGHYQTWSATANKSLGDLDVRLMSAYRTWDNNGTAVSRGQPYVNNAYIYQFPDYQSWQSELTVNGTAMDSRLKWTAGLFYFNERSPNDGGYLYLIPTSTGGPPLPAPNKQITITDGSRNTEENSSYAGYAQATYTVLEGTRLTAGVRYTYDERFAHIATRTIITPATQASTNSVANGIFDPSSYTYNGIAYAGQTHACTLTDASGVLKPLAQCASDVNASFHKPTWTLAVDHDLFDGTMVYATMRSGYRSGAINTGAINPLVTVAKPESVQDYEIGVKSDWALGNMPLRTNIALYQTAYHDIQTQQSLPNVTLATGPDGGSCNQAAYNAGQCLNTFNDNVTLNAKRARIYGGEWDITAMPMPDLTLSWSGSYLDARYTDYTFSPPPGYLLPTGTTNLSGTPFPLPRWQTNATVNYNFGAAELLDLPLGDAVWTMHYYWQSRYLADMRGFNPSQRTGAYGLLNLRLEFTDIGNSGMDLAGYINNAVGTKACLPESSGVLNSVPNPTFGVAGTSGVLQCIPLAPRMSGIELRYKF
jgi:iron complex outermembrane receptor protein